MKLSDQLLEKVEDHKDKIGDLLVKHTSLSNDQLSEALHTQQESGRLIGEILLKKNYIHPHDIVRVICYQMSIPFWDELKIEDIDPELISHIAINYAKTQEVLPVLELSLIHISEPTRPY